MKQMEAYLDRVCGEVRWKRAHAALRRELADHLREQKADCLAAGMSEDEAEAEAIRQMGDPVQTGRELNALHCPKSQWGLLCMTILPAAVGTLVRAEGGGEAALLRNLMFLVLGLGLLLIGYFLDYRRLERVAGPVCGGILLLGLLLLCAPMHNGVRSFALYGVQLYPLGYALGVYALRGKGWGGFAAALLLALSFAVSGCLVPGISMTLAFAVSAALTLVRAVSRGWFRVEKRQAYRVIGGASLVLLAVFLWMLIRSGRFTAALYPELDPMGDGWQGLALREALRSAALWGPGSPVQRPVSGAFSDYILSGLLLRIGLIPMILLCALLMLLTAALLIRCLRRVGGFGGLLALSEAVFLSIRIPMTLISLGGFVLFASECPFLSGGCSCAVEMGLVGLALSAFRQAALPEDDVKAARPAGFAEACLRRLGYRKCGN